MSHEINSDAVEVGKLLVENGINLYIKTNGNTNKLINLFNKEIVTKAKPDNYEEMIEKYRLLKEIMPHTFSNDLLFKTHVNESALSEISKYPEMDQIYQFLLNTVIH